MPSNEAAEQLTRALQDPFGIQGRANVEEWLNTMMSRYPLWSFQAWAYAKLQSNQLLTNFPLQLLINSILEDEDLTPRDWTVQPVYVEGQALPDHKESKQLTPLEAAIDRRRYWLCDQGRHGETLAIEPRAAVSDQYEQLLLSSNKSRFNLLYPLAEDDYGDPDNPNAREYKLLVRIAALVDQQRSASSSEERERTTDALQAILGPPPGRGRRRSGPQLDQEVERLLIVQGSELLGVCRSVFPRLLEPLPSNTMRAFDAERVSYDSQKEWAIRLALPCFSSVEVSMLRRCLVRSRRQPYAGVAAIYMLARRLHIDATTLAGRVADGHVRDRVAGDNLFSGI